MHLRRGAGTRRLARARRKTVRTGHTTSKVVEGLVFAMGNRDFLLFPAPKFRTSTERQNITTFCKTVKLRYTKLMPDDQMPRIILNTMPLQPVPPVSTPLPSVPASSLADKTQQRRVQVRAELEKLQQEENSLLNNMKDWLTKIQGSETKQQALERELFELDRTVAATPSPEQLKADAQKQLQQAQVKLTQIVNQQKIDEKKAFDNYAAGGLDRQGLLEEMERIRQRYAATLASAQAVVTQLQQQLNPLPPSPPQIIPTPDGGGTQGGGWTAPMSTALTSTLVQKLINLTEVQSGLGKQLLIDLPNQGTLPTIERSADGNGIIVTSGTTAGFLADADLLRAGATAEDIISLPVSQRTASEVPPLISPSPPSLA